MNLESIIASVGLRLNDQLELAAHQAAFEPAPESLPPGVREYLQATFPRGLYSHQSRAVAASLAGQDICLSTSKLCQPTREDKMRITEDVLNVEHTVSVLCGIAGVSSTAPVSYLTLAGKEPTAAKRTVCTGLRPVAHSRQNPWHP
jgi:hypothetical protein